MALGALALQPPAPQLRTQAGKSPPTTPSSATSNEGGSCLADKVPTLQESPTAGDCAGLIFSHSLSEPVVSWAPTTPQHVQPTAARRSTSFAEAFLSRAGVLLSLLVVQSLLGNIMASFEALIQDHVVITLFLTMLLGAGGNAGNQATVNCIRGLATGAVGPDRKSQLRLLLREAQLGASLGALLAAAAFARVWVWREDLQAATAIGLSAMFIVAVSAVVGAALPLLLVRLDVDPAHAGPGVQVAMDIVGVTITCLTCSAVFGVFAGIAAAEPPAACDASAALS